MQPVLNLFQTLMVPSPIYSDSFAGLIAALTTTAICWTSPRITFLNQSQQSKVKSSIRQLTFTVGIGINDNRITNKEKTNAIFKKYVFLVYYNISVTFLDC